MWNSISKELLTKREKERYREKEKKRVRERGRYREPSSEQKVAGEHSRKSCRDSRSE